MRRILFGLLSLLVAGPHSVFAAQSEDACAKLARLRLESVTVSKAEIAQPDFVAPATFFMVPGKEVGVPFCRVSGKIGASIEFELWLPRADAWNGKFMGVGNGGMAGGINYYALSAAVRDNFATVSSDLGHKGGVTDARFAINAPERIVDWGYRATHAMTVAAKAIATIYYAKPPGHSYFSGCSGGGRQGLMEAQRFPEDYDGILAGDPTIDFTHLAVGGRLWGQLALLKAKDGSGYIPADKLAALSQRVNSRCDAKDGLQDGVLDDPRQCDFDPGAMRCRGKESAECLTAPQADALRAIYRGARDKSGVTIYPGYERGGELGRSGWQANITGTAPFESAQWIYAANFLKGMVFEDFTYDPLAFDYDSDVARVDGKAVGSDTLASVINASDPNLSAYRAHGGKLLHYHGWNDPGVAPRASVAYYERVIERHSGLAEVQSFYRLFMAPGMQHCAGGPGPNAFGGWLQPPVPNDPAHNAQRALERWVEDGIAPDRLIATKFNADDPTKGILRTRPLCPYPQRAVYAGTGSSDEAASFVCR